MVLLQQSTSQGDPCTHTTKNLYLAKLDYDSPNYVRQVYKDLMTPELMQRSMKGRTRTQYPNKSLHIKIWIKYLKIKHAEYFRVKFDTQVTLLEHNFGHTNCHLLTTMFRTNKKIQKGLKRREKRRITPKKTKKKKRKAPKVPATNTNLVDFEKNLTWQQ